MDYKLLINSAIEARKLSYSPYSNFAVGAALCTFDDKIYVGCNIENAAYTPTNCAERTAYFKAVSEGEKNFKAIAIVGGYKNEPLSDYIAPCGVCRQVMAEFCDFDEFEVVLAKNDSDYKIYKLRDLLPLGFSPKDLNK